MLKVDDIHTYYGMSHVIQGISLEVAKGEVVCLIGRNGAGKTTTLKSIVGITPPRSGNVSFKGTRISGRRPYIIARSGIGYVPEDRRIFTNITVRDNLEIARRNLEEHNGSAWTIERIYEFFPVLKRLEHHGGGELSGGEQQMLAIARTLMGNPELVLMDEISEGLAPIIVKGLVTLIRKLREQTTILLAEQNVLFAFLVSDRGYVIDKGRIRYHGSINELRGNQEVKERYLAV